MISHMHETSFDFSLWRAGCLSDIGVSSRLKDIEDKMCILRKYAIGFCNGENLICRPKHNTKAVMFLKGDTQFWTHLTNREFELVFVGEHDET